MNGTSTQFVALAGLWLALLNPLPAMAQAAVPPRIPDSSEVLPLRHSTPLANEAGPLVEDSLKAPIVHLREVKVIGTVMEHEIHRYWQEFIGHGVSLEQMNQFKSWIYIQLVAKGYVGFVNISSSATAEGSVIEIEVRLLAMGSLKVVPSNSAVGKQYTDIVSRRLSGLFSADSLLDVAELDAQLVANTFDLPVELEAELHQVDDRTANVFITLHDVNSDAGKFQGGVTQLNNYGLQQYGQTQAMTFGRWNGFTPKAYAMLGFLLSEHIRYLRGDYVFPVAMTDSRIGMWGESIEIGLDSDINSQSRNYAMEAGISWTTLINATRYGSTYLIGEVSQRDSKDLFAGIELARTTDRQVRLKVKTTEGGNILTNFKADIGLYLGQLDLSANASNLENDSSTYHSNGNYSKVEFSGMASSNRLQVPWPSLVASMHWRGQIANKNLSSFSKMVLGGSNGIRAYPSSNGSADTGLVISFDLVHPLSKEVYAGVLYDIGWACYHHTPLDTVSSNAVELQGAGFKLGGTFLSAPWEMTLAKSFGQAESTQGNTYLGEVGQWRLGIEISVPF